MRIIVSIVLLSFVIACNNKNKEDVLYAKDELKLDPQEDQVWRKPMRKFSTEFNSYRRENDIPILPDSFILNKSGLDYAIWKNDSDEYPSLREKNVVWTYVDTSIILIWDVNTFKSKENEELIFRYQINEVDSSYKRLYTYVSSSRVRKHIDRTFYDSVLTKWGIK